MVSKERYVEMESRYQPSWRETIASKDFVQSNIEKSRFYFYPESLERRIPKPREFGVVALVLGPPLSAPLTRSMVAKQEEIRKVLDGKLAYFLEPQNFHSEIFLLAGTPEGQKQTDITPELLANLTKAAEQCLAETRSFVTEYKGIIITPDGTILLKGYDEGEMDAIRKDLRSKMLALGLDVPSRQSGWLRIPLGRILEQVGEEKFSKLKELVEASASEEIVVEDVTALSVINERRWYMTDKEFVKTITLRR
ncbi:MAG: hypothetical protein ACHQX1_01495 [Candidatus Micrarchaeales archaeon]